MPHCRWVGGGDYGITRHRAAALSMRLDIDIQISTSTTSGSLPSSVSRSHCAAGQHSLSRHDRPGRVLVAIEWPSSAHTMTTKRGRGRLRPNLRHSNAPAPFVPSTSIDVIRPCIRPLGVVRPRSERGRSDELAREHPPTGPDHRWADRIQPNAVSSSDHHLAQSMLAFTRSMARGRAFANDSVDSPPDSLHTSGG